MSAEFEGGLFFRQEAWHRQGIVVEEAPNIDEAFRLAEMNWTVKKNRLFARMGDELVPTERYALQRDKEGFERQILGYVSDRYEIFQNKDAFEWMRPLIESGRWRIETAGVLCEGKKVWALLHQDNIEIVPNDVMKKYLLFNWGHDGYSPAIFQPTMIRVVCDNTLQASLASGKQVRILHSKVMGDKMKFVQDLFTSTEDAFASEIEMFQRLLDKKMTVSRMEELIEKFYGGKKDNKISSSLGKQKVDFLKDFVTEKASGLKELGIQNTAYGFFNAISEANEHYLLNKKADPGINILFGSGLSKNLEILQELQAA